VEMQAGGCKIVRRLTLRHRPTRLEHAKGSPEGH
jgi:hypothetical protein